MYEEPELVKSNELEDLVVVCLYPRLTIVSTNSSNVLRMEKVL